MDPKVKTLEELATHSSKTSGIKSLVGFDGFVDEIVTPVDTRTGQGKHFTPIPSMYGGAWDHTDVWSALTRMDMKHMLIFLMPNLFGLLA